MSGVAPYVSTLALSGFLAFSGCTESREVAVPEAQSLHVAAVQAALDVGAVRDSGRSRIWMVPYTDHHLQPSAQPVTDLPEPVRQALTNAYPILRFRGSETSLFLCPPGVQVEMPGVGCPILEDGLIIALGPPSYSADGSVKITVRVVQSEEAGAYTQAIGLTLLMTKDEAGRWTRTGLGSWIT